MVFIKEGSEEDANVQKAAMDEQQTEIATKKQGSQEH